MFMVFYLTYKATLLSCWFVKIKASGCALIFPRFVRAKLCLTSGTVSELLETGDVGDGPPGEDRGCHLLDVHMISARPLKGKSDLERGDVYMKISGYCLDRYTRP